MGGILFYYKVLSILRLECVKSYFLSPRLSATEIQLQPCISKQCRILQSSSAGWFQRKPLIVPAHSLSLSMTGPSVHTEILSPLSPSYPAVSLAHHPLSHTAIKLGATSKTTRIVLFWLLWILKGCSLEA